MTTTDTSLLTASDLLRLHGEGERGELIRGVFRETMVPGRRHAKIAARLGAALFNFADARGLGTVMGELGVRVERDPDTVRGPDLCFASAERMPLDDDDPHYADVVPELIVEVRSPSDSGRELHEKALMWLDHGAILVWVIQPDTRTVDVYEPDRPVATLTADDALDGLGILPGFTWPVRAIFGA